LKSKNGRFIASSIHLSFAAAAAVEKLSGSSSSQSKESFGQRTYNSGKYPWGFLQQTEARLTAAATGQWGSADKKARD
jgi:hypothetical protein